MPLRGHSHISMTAIGSLARLGRVSITVDSSRIPPGPPQGHSPSRNTPAAALALTGQRSSPAGARGAGVAGRRTPLGSLASRRRVCFCALGSPALMVEQPAVYGREHAVAWQQRRQADRVETGVPDRAAAHGSGPAWSSAAVDPRTCATLTTRAVGARAPLRYVGVPPTCQADRTRTLHDAAPTGNAGVRSPRQVDRGRHDLCRCAAIPTYQREEFPHVPHLPITITEEGRPHRAAARASTRRPDLGSSGRPVHCRSRLRDAHQQTELSPRPLLGLRRSLSS
jgi:hypothetical protein